MSGALLYSITSNKQSVELTEAGFVGYLLEAGETLVGFTGDGSTCRLTLRTAQRTVCNERVNSIYFSRVGYYNLSSMLIYRVWFLYKLPNVIIVIHKTLATNYEFLHFKTKTIINEKMHETNGAFTLSATEIKTGTGRG